MFQVKSEYSDQVLDNYRIKSDNHLTKLLERFPNANWDYEALSRNPGLPWEFVMKNLDKKWSWFVLSLRPEVTIEVILRHPRLNWSISMFCLNTNLTPALVDQYRHKFDWNYKNLSINRNFDWSYVEKNLQEDWDFFALSYHRSVTWEIVMKYPNIRWDHQGLSMNPNITWEIITNNPQIAWCYYHLSRNPNINFEIVKANPQFPWSPWCISEHPAVTWEIVVDNPDYPWDFGTMSRNPNITKEIMASNPNHPWKSVDDDWYEKAIVIIKGMSAKEISPRPLLTWDCVDTDPLAEWDFVAMSRNLFLHDKTACAISYLQHVKKNLPLILGDYVCTDVQNLIKNYL